MECGKSTEHSSRSASEASADSGSLLNSDLVMPGRELTLTPTKRERRKSPATSSDNTSTSVQAPMSPTSSLADTTFEPTIDMMVNDFDDEATLNEEEALANLEALNPDDEIATLREESEMPIEELLAKYSMAPSPAASSSKRSSGSRRRRATKRQYQELDTETAHASTSCAVAAQQEKVNDFLDQCQDPGVGPSKENTSPSSQRNKSPMETDEPQAILSPDVTKKPHRSHLLDLYPDESFGESPPIIGPLEELESFTPLQALFEEVEVDDDDEDSDNESDDARKIIMVGTDYQADIPEGLSQYGDILPYENEDLLIWEPSQVSEREVEEYLAKIQETRALPPLEEGAEALASDEQPSALPAPLVPQRVQQAPNAASDGETLAVVKDNEQALHLLVQCGYDFNEALRRKRLNVLPLSDTMSSWSEEECLKFEEGIHKYGKDFYQIRQNQVRTRTMRELVHFYYLWKKSERRDQSFALNDTIDHMDVFLNEAGTTSGIGNGNGNGNGNRNGSCSPHSSNGHSNGEHALDKDTTCSSRKPSSKSYSIMTGGIPQPAGGAAGTISKRTTPAPMTLEDREDKEEEAYQVTI
ncbi:mesoderm induction early response protein 1 [Drosophila guanche]|uniref:mesoderm induction early response protein 1 n=1 Tax=Drosophila guanche TaxID=7266 RepID=UPI0014724199|nr:mesoderm induction early response protein 1 [Drosophila guanche]